MNSFFRDLVFGFRLLLKSPGFTAVAVLSLAVGIGVNSTVFGFLNAVLFRPVSVSNSEGLVYVFAGDRQKPYKSTSWTAYQEFSKQNEVFSGLGAYSAPPMLLTTGEQTEEINAEVVSANYFSVFGVRFQQGQPFTLSDDELVVSQPSVVVSDRFWKRRLNSDPAILGRQLILNGNSFTVAGVAPEKFTGMDPTISTEVWVPITQWATIVEKKPDKPVEVAEAQPTPRESGRLGRDHGWLQMIGRLKPGVTDEQAQAVMTTIAQRLQVNGQAEPAKVTLSPVTDIHPQIAEEMPTAVIILAVTGLVLMICCVNVASLMLARAAVRRKEFAVRLALGGTRARLVRQLMTEALILAVMGGILGLVFAYWTTRAVLGFLPGDFALTAGVAIDQRVLWFSFFISVLTAVFFGLLPALNTVRADLVQSLGADSMALGVGKRKINLRRALVVAQIVASFVLLIACGVFVRSFQNGRSVSTSLRSDRILVLNLSPRKYGYTVNYKKAFYRDLLNRIGAMPGVESATLSNLTPLTLERSTVSARIEGKDTGSLSRSVVSSGYFQTLNIPLVRGRAFEANDDESSRRVAIVNETMARTYWPDDNPLGKSVTIGPGAPYEIVGVAKDTSYNNLNNTLEPLVYVSLYQRGDESVSLIVRTSVEPQLLVAAMQREIKELGGNLPIFDFKTLDVLAKNNLLPVKAAAGLLGLLSMIGVLVAAIGLYGVTSYAFNQRRKEIGIRISLGAQRLDILKLIMKEGVSLALFGIIIGVVLAVGTIYVISSFIFGIGPIDPIVFVLVSITLAIVAVASSLAPAVLAANSDPVEALRHE